MYMGIRIQCAERKVKYIWSPEEASSVQSDPFKRGPIWNWIASSGDCLNQPLCSPRVIQQLGLVWSTLLLWNAEDAGSVTLSLRAGGDPRDLGDF